MAKGNTLTIDLGKRHDEALTDLATSTEMTKVQVLRHALTLYQVVHRRAQQGEQLAFTKDGVLVPVVIVGLGDLS